MTNFTPPISSNDNASIALRTSTRKNNRKRKHPDNDINAPALVLQRVSDRAGSQIKLDPERIKPEDSSTVATTNAFAVRPIVFSKLPNPASELPFHYNF